MCRPDHGYVISHLNDPPEPICADKLDGEATALESAQTTVSGLTQHEVAQAGQCGHLDSHTFTMRSLRGLMSVKYTKNGPAEQVSGYRQVRGTLGHALQQLPSSWSRAQELTKHYTTNEEGDRKGHVVEVSNEGVFPAQLLQCPDVPMSTQTAANVAAKDT